MSELTSSIKKLIKEFGRLPGVGPKTAERFTYHILRIPPEDALALADTIRDVKLNVHYCKKCFNLSESDLCDICQDPSRDTSTICIVEQPRDLMALEKTGAFHGLYHVLLGKIAPLENVGPKDLTLDSLVQRVESGTVKEIIMGTNPTTEGDGTAMYIFSLLKDFPIKITRLARGITSGSIIEFANKDMLSDALRERQGY